MSLPIPIEFMTIPYNGEVTPEVPRPFTIASGCNCQVFAYAILRHFGIELPPFRSSDLWEDLIYTFPVTEFEPLDLMLYNHDERAWGAHVGVYIGEQQVLHLSKKFGKPVVQLHSAFALDPQYAYFIGAKRPRAT